MAARFELWNKNALFHFKSKTMKLGSLSIFSATNAQLLAAHFSWFSCMLNKHSIILLFHLTTFIFESHFKSHFKKDAEKNSKSVRNLWFLSINIKSLMCRQSTVNLLCYTKTKNWNKALKHYGMYLHCESLLSAHCCDVHWLKWKAWAIIQTHPALN